MNDIKSRLISLLKKIYDNHDFVCGTMSNCGTEDAWKELYDYITYAKDQNKTITSDEILLLSLHLGEKKSLNSNKLFPLHGTAVAAL